MEVPVGIQDMAVGIQYMAVGIQYMADNPDMEEVLVVEEVVEEVLVVGTAMVVERRRPQRQDWPCLQCPTLEGSRPIRSQSNGFAARLQGY